MSRIVPMKLFSFVLFAVIVCGKEENIRADDVSSESIMAMVQNQAATISAMQAELAALKSSQSELRTGLSDCRADLAATKGRLNSYVGNQAVFKAHMSRTVVNVGSSGPFIFDAVVTNIGNGYNPHTGTFTAPFDGIYVFYFTMMNHSTNHWIHAVIEKSGTVLATASADGYPNQFDKGSTMATVQLQRGDQVYVRRLEGGTEIEGYTYTSFTGFLLSAEV